MGVWQNISERFSPRPSDVNGVDFGSTATKVVRIRRSGDEYALVGTEILPALDLAQATAHPNAFSIPLRIRARFAAVSLNVPSMSVKLLTLPGGLDPHLDQKLARHLGLPDDTTDRLGYHIVAEGAGRSESRVLAAALPENEANAYMRLFANGLPAPWSLEVSPIATLTAFTAGPVSTATDPAVGLVDFSSRFCTFSIFYRKSLVLLRRFDFGMDKILRRITSSLNVDDTTAANILADNAFDISELIGDIMQPLFSQLILSRDFVERRENCSISNLFLTGSLANAHAAISQIERALNLSVSIWDPFRTPKLAVPSPIPPEWDQQHWRFAAAIGAALAVLQENE